MNIPLLESGDPAESSGGTGDFEQSFGQDLNCGYTQNANTVSMFVAWTDVSYLFTQSGTDTNLNFNLSGSTGGQQLVNPLFITSDTEIPLPAFGGTGSSPFTGNILPTVSIGFVNFGNANALGDFVYNPIQTQSGSPPGLPTPLNFPIYNGGNVTFARNGSHVVMTSSVFIIAGTYTVAVSSTRHFKPPPDNSPFSDYNASLELISYLGTNTFSTLLMSGFDFLQATPNPWDNSSQPISSRFQLVVPQGGGFLKLDLSNLNPNGSIAVTLNFLHA